MKSFGARIYELRIARGWSQPKLAKLGDMQHGQVSYYESGTYKQAHNARNGPTLRLLVRFAKAFGMTIDELVRGVDPSL